MRTSGLCGVGFLACAFLFPTFTLSAAEEHGQVKFGGLPLPGATITATRDDKTFVAVADPQGIYAFPDLSEGNWNFQVEMLCFATIKQEVAVLPGLPGPDFEMKLLPLTEIQAIAPPAPPPPPSAPPPSISVNNKPNNKKTAANAPPANAQAGFQRTDVNAGANNNNAVPAPPVSDSFAGQNSNELNQRATDGLLINGSANNAATSPFSLAPAFGNNRRGRGSLYTGNLGLIFDNSALDAQQFSVTGQSTPKPAYNQLQGVANIQGPLRLPHVHFVQPLIFYVGYQWMHNRTNTTQPYLVPTQAQHEGAISPQAQALLNFYPLSNFDGGTRYNYQVALATPLTQNILQSRFNKGLGTKNQLLGTFNFQGNSAANPNLFGFTDKTGTLGINTGINWLHRFNQRLFTNTGYQFSRLGTTTTPYWANRTNVSAEAGITGNDQSPLNWGPPTLIFTSGIASLTDGIAASNHNQTSALSSSTNWYRSPHAVTFGGDFKHQQFNSISQGNPRGTLYFTGAATGVSDFQDFLLGIPDVSQIAFGNADKYFRSTLLDAFVNDDWRISPGLTLTLGVRWEYSSPITELYGRLVNLDIASGYSAVAPVVAGNPVGSLIGQHYPDSLVNPDRHEFQPRLAFAWRPFPASSMIVRGGYGTYYNTSIYQAIASQMAQQPPLSKAFNVQNSAADPLTLANGFNIPLTTSTNTFAIDPNFLVGYTQNWQLSVQRDLPAGLLITVNYLGIKGTRAPQQFLPNTYPIGAVNPCPSCPSGFLYMTSNGNSTREAGSFQLRRRLHNGLTASVQYTYAKAIDDAALGGRAQAAPVIAQNWLDLRAERGLSNFDQRHLLNFTGQYTTGMGIGGGTLLDGWRGRFFKEWTFLTQINAGTGLPLTPTYLAPVQGTGVAGPIRAEYTGAPVYAAPPGLFLNPAAYAAPPSGQWGNAGRDSITGPVQFSLNASMARTFRLNDRFNLDVRVDSANTLNHVTYQSWNTVVNSPLFGLPTVANPMRTLTTTLRLRF